MKHYLSNQKISIEIDSKSAELTSLKAGDREYLWQRDERYWDRSSPLLFPLTGGLQGGEYSLNGQTYKMPKHGFAIDSEFELKEYSEKKCTLVLNESDETLKYFPYRFELAVTYELNDDAVEVTLSVTNKGDDTMFFMIGAHPGFICPESGHNYVFYHDGNLISGGEITVLSPKGLLSHEKNFIEMPNGRLPITKDLFNKGKGTLVFLDTKINRVALSDEKNKEYVSVSFDTPVLALWSDEHEGASFACIEPWCGVCDYEDADKEWSKKPFMSSVSSHEHFCNHYSIKID